MCVCVLAHAYSSIQEFHSYGFSDSDLLYARYTQMSTDSNADIEIS